MKKITKLTSSLFFLLTAGGTQITMAQDVFVQENALTASQLTEIGDDQMIAFKGISATNSQCINWGSTSTSTLSANGVYTVETGNSENTFRLKRKVDGQYIGKNGDAITFVSDATQAASFTISQPQLNDSEVTGIHEVSLPNMTGTMNDKMATTEKTNVLSTSWAYGYQIRFTIDGTYLNIQGAGSTPVYKDGKGSWSIVMVYKVSEEQYTNALSALYQEMVTNSTKGSVGCLKATAAETLQQYINNRNYEAAKTLVAQEENFITFNPSLYYRIENLARKYSTHNDTHLNDGGYLEVVDNLEMPIYTATNGFFSNDRSNSRVNAIWKFVSNGTDGQYYLQNMNAGTYMPGTDGKYVTSGVTSTDGATAYTLASLGNGQFNIKKANSEQRLHASGNTDTDGAAVMLYNQGVANSPSAWYIIPATTIEKEITDAGYATVNYPFAVQVPEDVTAYTGTANAEDGVFTLKEIESGIIPANTPVVLQGKADTYSLSILADNTEEPLTGNDLSGSTLFKEVDGSTTAYILGNGGQGVGFYQINDTERTLGANKAYLELSPSVQAVRSLIFSDGTTTGIESTVAEGTEAEEYYDLQGRRVMNPTKGIYVTKSGKKVLFNK